MVKVKWTNQISKGENLWRLPGSRRRIRKVTNWLVEKERNQSWHDLSSTLLIRIPITLKRSYGVYYCGCNPQGEYITPLSLNDDPSIWEYPREWSATISHRPSNNQLGGSYTDFCRASSSVSYVSIYYQASLLKEWVVIILDNRK